MCFSLCRHHPFIARKRRDLLAVVLVFDRNADWRYRQTSPTWIDDIGDSNFNCGAKRCHFSSRSRSLSSRNRNAARKPWFALA